MRAGARPGQHEVPGAGCRVMPPHGGGSVAKLSRHPFQTNSASQRRTRFSVAQKPDSGGYGAGLWLSPANSLRDLKRELSWVPPVLCDIALREEFDGSKWWSGRTLDGLGACP